jgi:hypothetical protein
MTKHKSHGMQLLFGVCASVGLEVYVRVCCTRTAALYRRRPPLQLVYERALSENQFSQMGVLIDFVIGRDLSRCSQCARERK